MPRRKRSRVAHSENPTQESFVSAGELLDSTAGDRHAAQIIVESNPGLPPDPRSSMCRCGREQRTPGRAFGPDCEAGFAKLWTTPPDPRYGPCREVE